MKTIVLFFGFLVFGFANDKVYEFASNEECRGCHAKIYDEYAASMHASSTPDKDVIHKAIWDKHPHNTQANQYSCGKCHAPASKNLDKMLAKGEKAPYDAKDDSHAQAVSCAYCHRIERIEKHPQSNTNIISKEANSYYGSGRGTLESPYHKIQSKNNEHFANGNVCVGCHSHNVNAHGLNLCSTNNNDELSKANCVSCHMPQVAGSVTELSKGKTHSFHGFAGAHSNSEMLAKYIDIAVLKNIDHFIVNVDNRSSHAMLLHPLRLAVLKISVVRNLKTIELDKEVFVRVIGKDEKPAMPWAANATIKDTMIGANEKRAIKREFKLEKGDRVDVLLGYHLVNPQALEALGLKEQKVATEFTILKKQSFQF